LDGWVMRLVIRWVRLSWYRFVTLRRNPWLIVIAVPSGLVVSPGGWLPFEPTAHLVVSLTTSLGTALDKLVAAGVVASRAKAVRVGLEQFIDRAHRALIGERIVDGYRAIPPGEPEVGWSDHATVDMLADEPGEPT
jgi:hypothetical protein